jgi:DNA mismatch repair protein MutS2
MDEKTLRLLEFDAVRLQVAERSLSGEAAARILQELPLTDAAETAALKRRVSRIADRLQSGDPEPLERLPDMGPVLRKLEREGSVLEIDEAYALALFVERGEALKKWLLAGQRDAGEGGPDALGRDLPDCADLAAEVFRIIDREGKLRDLPVFRAIKQRIQSLKSALDAAVQRYTGSEEYRRMLQSALPSQRNGRAVLALKANFRGRIRGIVHEVSASGQTLFVEPEEAVEKNNAVVIAGRELDAAIRQTLRNLTRTLAPQRPALGEFHEGILTLETLRARARYSQDIAGVFAQEGFLNLAQGRHPLLGKRAVPIDFALGGETRGVIITGPNAGGKTAALKTVGLFALMNQFGLALPAGTGTSLPVFEGIYADIGDEQSLSQSLSTFSAHMTAIAAITQAAGERSLALLDELGSGTDPQDGGAIAMAILDYLIQRGSRIIVTTHHGALKQYGYARREVENASVDFDARTLSPVYRIVMGIPGASRAVDIAQRNGLPAEIIQNARRYLADEQSDVSALIASLTRKHADLDAEALRIKAEADKLREERRQADQRELRLSRQALELKEDGMGRFRLLLSESRKTLENLVREIREGELSREKTLKVKEFIRELEETAAAEAREVEAEQRRVGEEQSRLLREEAEGEAVPAAWGTERPHLGPGAEVLVGEARRRGRIVRGDKKGSWVVEIGSLKIAVKEEDLIPLKASAAGLKPLMASVQLVPGTRASFELNLRGMRLDEALDALGRQIDAAVVTGLQEFAVVHGKGDGILQRGVHDFLKHQPPVADYYFSRPELGGFGRTEVILKRG